MTLLVHRRVLAVRRLRVTAAVTIRAVVCIAGRGGILPHALAEARTLRAVLRTGCVARCSRLVPDRRELRMAGCLPRDSADRLSHLTVDRSVVAVVVGAALFGGSLGFFCSLALCFLFLLLGFPFLADFLELW